MLQFAHAAASGRRAGGASPARRRQSGGLDTRDRTVGFHPAPSPRREPVPKDMRTWIAELDAAGELIHVDKHVDPLTQMGALLYQSREKALLFENLPHGWRSLGQAPANVRHAALAFGAREDTVVPLVAERMGARIPPIMVSDGPVKEVKLARGQFDLCELPVHVAGQRDA